MTWQPEIDELRERQRLAAQMGGDGGSVGSVLDPTAQAKLPPAVADAVRQGLAESLHTAFLVGLPILAVVFVATALIPAKPLRETLDHPAQDVAQHLPERNN